METLYNSDSYAVVEFASVVPEGVVMLDAYGSVGDGYEIVDKLSRKEIFIQGALALQFKQGVDALIETSPSVDEVDDFLEQFACMAQQPVVMH